MTDNEHTLISVRGEAERVVAPDAVRLSTSVSVGAKTKAAAATIVARALAALTSALEDLGGRALTISTTRAPLTWSTYGIGSHEEWDHSETARRSIGHRSTAELAVTVRDFVLLDRLAPLLTAQEEVNIRSVSWSVDDDNPGWAQVRADAIQVALLKARDYATALWGAVTRVEHVADGGLLAGESSGRSFARRASAVSGLVAQSAHGDEDGVSLDPVPQTITAVIEARVTAAVGPLPT